MSYMDIAICAVPEANKAIYTQHAEKFVAFVKSEGATECTECWGDDVHEGKLTSFPMAVKQEDGEVVCVSVYKWPDKATRDAAWAKMMSDDFDTASMGEMPFDGKRMIFGGFEAVLEA